MPKKKSRASNGMGSIRQRPDGRWEARYSGPDGRQHSVYGKTEKEVTAKLRGALHDMDSGAWREPSKMTVGEWLEIWQADYQAHITPRTHEVYAGMIRLHIVPIIGGVKMSSLLPLHVRRVINAMTEKGLSANYIHHCHGVMSVAFKSAIEAGLLKSNPTKGVKTARIIKKKLTIVDREQIPAFIEAAMESPHGLAMIFLLMTGLRAGEERGLKWEDCDIENKRIHIQRQIPCKASVGFIPPKDGSVRTIEITPEAANLLKQQKKRLAELRLAAGDKWISNETVDELVFRSERGLHIAESVLHKAVHAVGDKIGLPGLHPHDLRHSYAVAALRSGVDVKTVQNNLGHRNATMTLDVYAAYTTDAGKVGAAKLSEYWQSALKNS